MADTTIVNTPARRGEVDTADNAVGWVIAAIVLVAIIVGAVVLLRRGAVTAPTTVPGTNVQVSLPSGSGGSGSTGSGSTGAGAGSTGAGAGASGSTGAGY